MYLYAVDFLSRHGFRQYEISNFARPGYESRHNLKYWRLDDYIGFGAAAASNIGLLRYTYTHNVREYISGVLGDKGIIAEEEELTPFDRASEYLMLGMRTAAGISREEYRSVYQSSFDKLEEMLEVFQENGWPYATTAAGTSRPAGSSFPTSSSACCSNRRRKRNSTPTRGSARRLRQRDRRLRCRRRPSPYMN